MRKMGAVDVFVTIFRNVSFTGKTWWMLMLVFRLLVLLLAGFTLFSDEQERFVCNTIQPGCSNVCFDTFTPVSLFHLWMFHLILLCLPQVMFATYIMHKVLSNRNFGADYYEPHRGNSPFALENSSSSTETSLSKAPLRDWSTPRFHRAYFLVVIVRILLEMAFGAGQFFLMGLSMPKSFLCREAPCTSGVECYVSRPTEKTLMLHFMLGVASLSVLLSLVDLASSVQTMVRWRRRREMLMEEMSKGEQSSVFTSASGAEDTDVLLTKRSAPGGNSQNGIKDEKIINLKAAEDKSPGCNDVKVETSRPPTPMPSHFVLHSHLRPPLSPRLDRGPGPAPSPRPPTTPIGANKLSHFTPVGSGQQSDSSESQEKRAWV
ncbi:gap junction delta-3 protein-like [Diretmus argenteus]